MTEISLIVTLNNQFTLPYLTLPLHFLYINQTRGHINRLSLICRIHRIVNSNGIRLKWSVRKLANILPMVMWRNIDIDFFDFSLWHKYMDRSTLIFIEWEIKSRGFKLPCIYPLFLIMMHKCNDLCCILLRKCVCNTSIKKYILQFISFTAKGKDGVLISHILISFSWDW